MYWMMVDRSDARLSELRPIKLLKRGWLQDAAAAEGFLQASVCVDANPALGLRQERACRPPDTCTNLRERHT